MSCNGVKMLSIPVCEIYTNNGSSIVTPAMLFYERVLFRVSFKLRSLNDFNCSYFVSIAFAVGIVNSYTCSLLVDGCIDMRCVQLC